MSQPNNEFNGTYKLWDKRKISSVWFAPFLSFPLFVKPAKAGDSLGVDNASKVNNLDELKTKVKSILDGFGTALVEEYIDGREFTVLVCANADGKTCTSFVPVEYIFPKGFSFKTYALKTSELHPNANIAVSDIHLAKRLQTMAEQIFLSFSGVGYARMDFRMNKNEEIFNSFKVDAYGLALTIIYLITK